MSAKSGIARQIGWVSEVTPGTAVVAGMTFQPLVSSGLDKTADILRSAAQRASRDSTLSEEVDLGAIKCGGPVGIELTNKGLRYLFKNLFGTESGAGPYTYTPGDLAGLALTIQEGVPDNGGTVRPYTFVGCKFPGWELAIEEGKICTLGLDVIAMNCWDHRTVTDGVTTDTSAAITSATAAFGYDDVGKPISGTGIPAATTILSVTSTTAATLSAACTATATGITFTIGLALASASYTSGTKPLHYVHSSLTLGGTAVKIKALRLKGDNKITERRFGGQRTTDEPLGNDRKSWTGMLTAEFADNTQYKRFLNRLEVALVITISNGTDSVTITANVLLTGSKAKGQSNDITPQEIPFECISSAAGADSTAITAVLSGA